MSRAGRAGPRRRCRAGGRLPLPERPRARVLRAETSRAMAPEGNCRRVAYGRRHRQAGDLSCREKTAAARAGNAERMIMNDDTLILYYYDDGLSEEERAAVAAALEQDARLRERYRALRSELERLSEQPITAAPREATARWHRHIENAASAERSAWRIRDRVRRFPWLSLAAPLAAALVAGIAIGLYLGAHDSPAPPVAEPGNTIARDDRPGAQALP